MGRERVKQTRKGIIRGGRVIVRARRRLRELIQRGHGAVDVMEVHEDVGHLTARLMVRDVLREEASELERAAQCFA